MFIRMLAVIVLGLSVIGCSYVYNMPGDKENISIDRQEEIASEFIRYVLADYNGLPENASWFAIALKNTYPCKEGHQQDCINEFTPAHLSPEERAKLFIKKSYSPEALWYPLKELAELPWPELARRLRATYEMPGVRSAHISLEKRERYEKKWIELNREK